MKKELKIESKANNLRIVENAIDTITREAGINQENYGKIMVSVMEAVNNAILHGNKSDESKLVEITMELTDDQLLVTVTDQGKGFKPGEVPDPTEPDNIEKLSGRGVFLMTKLADKIEFNKKGNSVKMTFKHTIS